jgi:hypothetical protein
VTCLEVIEHLDKQHGSVLVRQMERVGKIVFLSTPARFFEQDKYDDNVFQQHKSVWTSKELNRLGYKVRGFGDLEFNFGALGRVFLPDFCETLFAWKTAE